MDNRFQRPFFLIVIGLLAVLSIGIVWFSLSRNRNQSNQTQPNSTSPTVSASTKSQVVVSRLYEPVLNFKQRVTKKAIWNLCNPSELACPT